MVTTTTKTTPTVKQKSKGARAMSGFSRSNFASSLAFFLFFSVDCLKTAAGALILISVQLFALSDVIFLLFFLLMSDFLECLEFGRKKQRFSQLVYCITNC